MSMRKDIEDILQRAVRAPSGDNIQPWSFVSDDAGVLIRNDTKADISFYNHRQSASLMSIGALIENVRLVVAEGGKGVNIELFPFGTDSDIVARLSFEGEAFRDGLVNYIERRMSNRLPYKDLPLKEAETRALASSAATIVGVRIRLLQGEAKDRVAAACAVNERIVLENRTMHDFFFEHITWTDVQDREHPGFYIDTLELNLVQKAVFRLYRYWPAARLLNTIGFSKLISDENAKTYCSSSAVAAILIESADPASYVHGGMALQRLWLTVTSLDLWAQPMAGVCFLAPFAKEDTGNHLSDVHRKILVDAYSVIQGDFECRNMIPAVILRIGHAPPPRARTRRRAVTLQ